MGYAPIWHVGFFASSTSVGSAMSGSGTLNLFLRYGGAGRGWGARRLAWRGMQAHGTPRDCPGALPWKLCTLLLWGVILERLGGHGLMDILSRKLEAGVVIVSIFDSCVVLGVFACDFLRCAIGER
ncbi:hypothetical protein BKA58DRAFT_118519 [Alternaria rosae]|uniref:uncharacterized protein n=1 Tax=Alternaria rosae TaxID=1187941 RepID=UPI001E8E4F1F|nr:uncharacterized protein BKA58DRAFT_118519 [Alternaria rosae]KAH6875289.1 hypothetical protein BKA58DRAFT_118519 [Alternaria rosae]